MTIFEFLELSAGQWFTHRTSHHVNTGVQDGQKSNLAIELVGADSPAVQTLCHAHQLDPTTVSAAEISWESLPDLNQKKQTGADLLLFVPNPENTLEGAIYRKQSASTSTTGRYSLNAEERLTLITEGDNLHVEEHIWFESPNVRIRHSVILQHGEARLISFASEIRRVSAPPKS